MKTKNAAVGQVHAIQDKSIAQPSALASPRVVQRWTVACSKAREAKVSNGDRIAFGRTATVCPETAATVFPVHPGIQWSGALAVVQLDMDMESNPAQHPPEWRDLKRMRL